MTRLKALWSRFWTWLNEPEPKHELPEGHKKPNDPDLPRPDGPLGPSGGQVGNPQRF